MVGTTQYYAMLVTLISVAVSAIVTITQYFWQYLSYRLSRAKYVFPVPVKAAVCGFEMVTADGTVITAVAKEKDLARYEHEAAIHHGYTTGLVEHVTDDSASPSSWFGRPWN